MKKLLIASFVFASVAASAQTATRTSAYMSLKDGKLDKALEFIEPTIEHPKTMEDPKTWLYRGNIYYAIAISTDEAYKNLSENPLKVAVDSYLKAKELDEKEKYKEDINMQLLQSRINALNGGVALYQEEKFNNALNNFELAIEIAKASNSIDTSAIFNGALSAEKAKNYTRAEELYKKSIELGYLGVDSYLLLVGVYKATENNEAAKAILEEAKAKYPGSQGVILEEANLYFRLQDFEKAQQALVLAIDGDPENLDLRIAVAGLLEKLERYEDAKKAYVEILEKDPNNFEANQLLGALLFNDAVELNNKANEILDNKKFAEAVKVADAKFKESQPYLEKALEIKPDDLTTLGALKQLYVRIKENDKYNAVKDRIEQLTK